MRFPLLLVLVLVLSCAGARAQTAAVCIDPGHGDYDPGAVGNGLEEKDLNLEAGLAFRDWLDEDDSDGNGGGTWDVYMTRDTDVFVSLTGRCDYANGLGVDYFLSIHTNAGGGNGTETYAYAAGTEADALADKVQDEVLDHLGTYDRGVKYANFTVLTNTAMPADLNEMAFIDVWAGNAELLSDPANLDHVGLGHLHAIQRHNGLTSYTPSANPGQPWARVEFDSHPGHVAVDESFTVEIGYETNLHELGQSGQIGVTMQDVHGWDVLDEVIWTNGGAGIQGPAGSHSFGFQAPSVEGEVFFVVWFAPLGGDWADRYDDASTLDDPTAVTAAGDDDDVVGDDDDTTSTGDDDDDADDDDGDDDDAGPGDDDGVHLPAPHMSAAAEDDGGCQGGRGTASAAGVGPLWSLLLVTALGLRRRVRGHPG